MDNLSKVLRLKWKRNIVLQGLNQIIHEINLLINSFVVEVVVTLDHSALSSIPVVLTKIIFQESGASKSFCLSWNSLSPLHKSLREHFSFAFCPLSSPSTFSGKKTFLDHKFISLWGFLTPRDFPCPSHWYLRTFSKNCNTILILKNVDFQFYLPHILK